MPLPRARTRSNRALTHGGAIAQLGERLNGIQEVVGSIPIGSTNVFKRLCDTLAKIAYIPDTNGTALVGNLAYAVASE